jgi:hypothetical protein
MSAITFGAGKLKVTNVICDKCQYKEQYLGIDIKAARSDLKQVGWRYTKPNKDKCGQCILDDSLDEGDDDV